jgi:sugar lactone lactonase YvrE
MNTNRFVRILFNPTRSKDRLPMLVMVALAIMLGSFTPAAAQRAFPDVIMLPDGFQPEGITTGYGTSFYVGSIPTGAIYRGDLRTGEGAILVPSQEGRWAIGLDFDKRSGYLFVAGGPTGQAYVYHGESGEAVAVYQLEAPGNVFINDVIVTRQAAYFTNSFAPYIYRLPLGPAGTLPDESEIERIELVGDFMQVDNFNANGIEAAPNGKWLIVVNSSLGTLYRVDPHSGHAKLIPLSGVADSVPFGDGILLLGHTLYVVQNRLNQIAVIELSPHYSSGEVVDIITDEDFRVPTTVAMFGRYLYAVNARFDTPPTPDTEYEVVRVVR